MTSKDKQHTVCARRHGEAERIGIHRRSGRTERGDTRESGRGDASLKRTNVHRAPCQAVVAHPTLIGGEDARVHVAAEVDSQFRRRGEQGVRLRRAAIAGQRTEVDDFGRCESADLRGCLSVKGGIRIHPHDAVLSRLGPRGVKAGVVGSGAGHDVTDDDRVDEVGDGGSAGGAEPPPPRAAGVAGIVGDGAVDGVQGRQGAANRDTTGVEVGAVAGDGAVSEGGRGPVDEEAATRGEGGVITAQGGVGDVQSEESGGIAVIAIDAAALAVACYISRDGAGMDVHGAADSASDVNTASEHRGNTPRNCAVVEIKRGVIDPDAATSLTAGVSVGDGEAVDRGRDSTAGVVHLEDAEGARAACDCEGAGGGAVDADGCIRDRR